MKVVAVIPARYKSTRFEGKPLANICGKPMIWWVYQQVLKVDKIDVCYVATDDERIVNVCNKYNIKVIKTNSEHPDHISRVQEVSEYIHANIYVCINGDEPLIEPNAINKVLNVAIEKYDEDNIFIGAMRDLTSPPETIDFSNIKLAIGEDNKCIYMSRSPIPYPRATLSYNYKKYIGIECFTKQGLDFFVNKPMGVLEKIEDIDHLRFIENGVTLYFELVDSESLSVDTPKDLDKVIDIITKRQKK